ncbi:glycoside hydrolase family 43 protein [Sphingomonas sp. SM33]|uniref:Glycoside hydrolase family 43 protein n=1 Tax=Sphingomonas telluris TaxID=2907998 RepID=A0ABS9VKC6_9SPHN|nr:glycoside hydrolase family 43 protein [Sphingomonas telluris]MCH8615433.1 glycoside hydrolase family 43 protein [Sphingomonas telluris]
MSLLLAAAVARFDWFEYRGDDKLPKPSPSEYANPILQGFYPDPSITRVGDDYYLINSTFDWFPGIPIFHSRDLVHWTQIGNAIDRPDQLDFKSLGLSRGVFAPDISWHDGTFYILNTCVDCGGNFVITAKDAAGPWSNPIWLPDLEGGIDPSLFFDADGSAWIINNGAPPGTPLYDGHRAIWVQRFDTETLRSFGPRTMILNGGVRPEEKPIWIEGPHIFRKDGWYYLIAAEGGTAENHSQVVLRSRAVIGPYEAFSGNPILTQRDLPRDRPNPITSAGHADFVETPNGEWWATFLATRPYAGDFYNTGRETFLMPVRWADGWPRITDPGAVIPWTAPKPNLQSDGRSAPPTNGSFTARDEFNSTKLPLNWMMMRNPREHWWRIGDGQLTLQARPVALGDNGNPSFLARRQQHLNATATTALRFTPTAGGEAGLVALQSDEYFYFLSVGENEGKPVIRLHRRAGPNEPKIGAVVKEAALPVPAGTAVYLRAEARGANYDFSWSADGRRWHILVKDADGTILSTKRAGGFVGSMFGVHAYQPQSVTTERGRG